MKRLNAIERKEAGYRTIADIANLFAIDRTTIKYHIKMGWVAEPKERFKDITRLYYNPEQVKELIKFYNSWTPYRVGKEDKDE